MTLQRRQLTAVLLLAVWPMTIGLATGWHVHSHSGDCSGDHCVPAVAEHAHSHDHHHGHEHSHDHDHHAPAERPEKDHSWPIPHESEDCQSCQVLALTGTTFAPVAMESNGELLERIEASPQKSSSLAAPSCLHLRGPPARIVI